MIDEAQFASIRESRVKAMDETLIKAGQAAPGQLKKAYFWPVQGERDEIGFPCFASLCPRCGQDRDHAGAVLGAHPPRLL